MHVIKEFGVAVGVDEHQARMLGVFIIVGNKVVRRCYQVVPAVEGDDAVVIGFRGAFFVESVTEGLKCESFVHEPLFIEPRFSVKAQEESFVLSC